MSVAPPHRLYNHYSELPLSMRILYTGALCILGMGYLFAITYLVHTYSGRDGKPGITKRTWSSPMPAAAKVRSWKPPCADRCRACCLPRKRTRW